MLVVDFGAQYAQLIARRVREANVYSEIVPHTATVEQLVARRPSAIVLSGGPESVYAEGAPKADPALFETGVPVLGICYGLQAMAVALGGVVARTSQGEFGRTVATIEHPSVLLDGLPERTTVWMSHCDSVVRLPAGFRRTAGSPGAEIAAFEDASRALYGLQWHPEVAHTEMGQRVIENFLYRGAGIRPTWTTGNIIEGAVKSIAATVGAHPVIAGLSGGVDSAVAAALVQRAVGDRLTCVFVDHGLLREGEREQVENDYVKATGVKLHTVDASRRFLDALAAQDDPADPESKRKTIGREFIRTFEAAAKDVLRSQEASTGGHQDDVEVPGPGDPLPRCGRIRRGDGRGQYQEPPQRGRPAGRPALPTGRASAGTVQGRSQGGGRGAGAAARDRLAPALPRAGLAIRIVGAVNEERLAVLQESRCHRPPRAFVGGP